MTAWFVAWIVTTQCVNIAFFLAVTRMAYGRWQTVGAYVLFYLVPLVSVFYRNPLLHGGVQGAVGNLSLGFVVFYSLWAFLAMTMSRGVAGRRLFAVAVCGVHQVVAFAVSLLLMRRLRPEWLGALLGCVLMALLGWFLLVWVRSRVSRMPDRVRWPYLNAMAVALFVILYASGIWPTFVASASWEAVARFALAVVGAAVLLALAPVLAGKSRTGAPTDRPTA